MPELIAYPEAGHALMGLLLGGKVRLVAIEPDKDNGPDRQGDTQVLWRRSEISDKEFAKTAVQVSLIVEGNPLVTTTFRTFLVVKEFAENSFKIEPTHLGLRIIER